METTNFLSSKPATFAIAQEAVSEALSAVKGAEEPGWVYSQEIELPSGDTLFVDASLLEDGFAIELSLEDADREQLAYDCCESEEELAEAWNLCC